MLALQVHATRVIVSPRPRDYLNANDATWKKRYYSGDVAIPMHGVILDDSDLKRVPCPANLFRRFIVGLLDMNIEDSG